MNKHNIKINTHYQEGMENEIACIFSCPGQHEEKAKCPAAKVTGKNLIKLFDKLNVCLNSESFIRSNVTITNSWSKVEYPELTGRTEANKSEILNKENLKRLCDEVKKVNKYIICFGDKSLLAIDALKSENRLNSEVKIIKCNHLSLSRINRVINKDIDGKPILSADKQKALGDNRSKRVIQDENTLKRIEVIAENIINQIKTV